MHTIIRLLSILIITLFWFPLANAGPDDSLEDLLEEKKFNEAYRLGRDAFNEDAGKPVFDFLYGLAAVESGHAADAVFSFSRVLNAEPSNIRALFELGRSYFRINSFGLAQDTFKEVLAHSPDPDLTKWAERYLKMSVKSGEHQKRWQFDGEFNIYGGYSTNVNTGADVQYTFIPVGNLTRPAEVSQGYGSGYVEGDAVSQLRYRISDRGGIKGRIKAAYKKFFSNSDFDTLDLGFDAALESVVRKLHFSLPVGVKSKFVNYEVHKWEMFGGPRIGYDINKHNRLSLSGKLGFRKFLNNIEKDATDFGFGMIWQLWLAKFESVLSLYGNISKPRFDSQAFRVADFFGVTLGARYRIAPKHSVLLFFNAEHSAYRAINLQYNKKKSDWLIDSSLEYRWNFYSDFTLKPAYKLSKVFSNVLEYNNIRHEIQLGIAWDFSL